MDAIKTQIADALRIPKHTISDTTTIRELILGNGNLLIEEYDIVMRLEELFSVELSEPEILELVGLPLVDLPTYLTSKRSK